MTLYLLLIIFFGLIILLAVGALIFGIVKNQKHISISSAILLVIGTIGCVYSGIAYSTKVYQYVRGNEFQED